MMEDRFSQNDPIPLFLAGHTEEAGQPGVRNVASSDVFRKATLVFAAAATIFAVVSVGKAIVFASVTASEAGTAALPVVSGSQSAPASTPAIQSANSAEALPAPSSGGALLAAFKAAVENKAEVDQPKVDQPKTEALINQFKAWAAEEDAQAPAPSPQPPPAVQAARAEIVPLPETVPLPKRRPTHVEQTTRAHDPSPQNAPSLLRQFGWRN